MPDKTGLIRRARSGGLDQIKFSMLGSDLSPLESPSWTGSRGLKVALGAIKDLRLAAFVVAMLLGDLPIPGPALEI